MAASTTGESYSITYIVLPSELVGPMRPSRPTCSVTHNAGESLAHEAFAVDDGELEVWEPAVGPYSAHSCPNARMEG